MERDAAGASSHGRKGAVPPERTYIQLGVMDAGNQEVLINSMGEKKKILPGE